MTIGGNIMGDFDFIQMKKEKLQKQSKILTIVGGIFTAITLVLAIIFLIFNHLYKICYKYSRW